MGNNWLGILATGEVVDKVVLLQALVKSDGSQISEEILAAITKSTNDADLGVKFWAKKVLAKFQATSKPTPTKDEAKGLPIDLLLQKLTSAGESSFVSLDTIKKLCDSKASQVVQPLVAYLQSCKDIVQISYLTKQLGICYPSEELIPVLQPFLQHDDERVVSNTIEGLEGIHSEKCVKIISQLLMHKSNRVKANAAKALSRFDREKSLAILSGMLQMKDKPHYVISACFAAKELRDESLLDYLSPLLDEEMIFIDALKAIEAYGSSSAVDIIQSSIDQTDDVDKKAMLEDSLKRIRDSKVAAPRAQSINQASKKGETGPHASKAAKMAVEALASKVDEIPQSYFNAIRELHKDPFKGQEKAINILNEREASITGLCLSLLLPLCGILLAFMYVPQVFRSLEFYFKLAVLLWLLPASFSAAFAIIGATITTEKPGNHVAIFAGGLSLMPLAVTAIVCGLIGPGNVELSLICAVYGVLITLMVVQGSLTYIYKMSAYKCMILSPAIFLIAGYIFKVLLFSLIPNNPRGF